MPRVSAIIPAYNQAEFLPDSVGSISLQTFPDWEAIIVDDGSTDDTAQVASQINDRRVRYIRQENMGLSRARNSGIQAANGEYIALLDADDRWDSRFLDRMLEHLRSSEYVGAAYCGFRYMDSEGTALKQSVCRIVPAGLFRRELLVHGNWLSACGVVVRASVYADVGLFDESLRACEDYDMWLRISETYPFVGVPETLVWYRRSGNNMSLDVDRMTKALNAVLEKHVNDGRVPSPLDEKHKLIAVSQPHIFRVQACLSQGRCDEAAKSLRWLTEYRPDFAFSTDLWYSLACVHQPIGQRGDFDTWDLQKGAGDVLSLLAHFNSKEIASDQRGMLYGQACLALAMLSYGTGKLGPARHYLLAGPRKTPALMTQPKWKSLALRLLPGIAHIRRWRKSPGKINSAVESLASPR